ncbi:MAG: hypothetical protein JJE49_10500 [Peptostreptococcaceae bacterium]|nr:hypothetical protein [Peptostreptococcaceae bacterium]
MATGTEPVSLGVDPIHIITVLSSTETLSIADTDISAGETPADNAGILPAYLQYTTITDGTATYKITAELGSTDVLPAGTELQLITTPGTTTTAGDQGTGVIATAISATAVDIVTAIPSCNTGTTTTSGAMVEHVLHIKTLASLVTTAAANVTITYTILDTV